jgi:peptide/nickel transport system ATP-binding protein
MKGNDKLLVVQDLTKQFTLRGGFIKMRLVAVNKACFAIGSAGPEIFTLAGESGSGKTTVARMILGFIEPTAGNIFYRGRDVTRIKKRKDRMRFTKEVQAIFQDPFDTFNPLKKIDTYLYETALNYGISRSRKDTDEVIAKALSVVGLSLQEIKDRYPHELSGGQAQRISVARALITGPSLLVADEPVSMVDASLRMSIVNLFKQLKEERGISVIYITHDLTTAYYVSDRIAIMLRGNIVEIGTVDQVLIDPLHPYTRMLRDSVPEPDPRKRWRERIELSSLEMKEYGRTGCKFAGRCPKEMDVCRKENPHDIAIDGRIVQCHLFDSRPE